MRQDESSKLKGPQPPHRCHGYQGGGVGEALFEHHGSAQHQQPAGREASSGRGGLKGAVHQKCNTTSTRGRRRGRCLRACRQLHDGLLRAPHQLHIMTLLHSEPCSAHRLASAVADTSRLAPARPLPLPPPPGSSGSSRAPSASWLPTSASASAGWAGSKAATAAGLEIADPKPPDSGLPFRLPTMTARLEPQRLGRRLRPSVRCRKQQGLQNCAIFAR